MEYTLNMVFLTAGAKKTTFSITDVKSTLAKAQVVELMDNILKENIFTTSSGDLVKKDSATIVAKTVTQIKMD
ncbi:DUF2922 domain-containing protein [Clostridium beijerinckii]|uniref:DUF2922 domain-containing protein n=1 Tax=Clostridium beijerinckii TaxID=1520 RepID=UPI00047AFA83|nr:DUF2922 domain-containing protein [Clostridium beijerinckii]